MKEAIDRIFRIKRLDKNSKPSDRIEYIEHVYQTALDYVRENAQDERQLKMFSDYAHVLFSKLLLENVSVEDYVNYLEMKTTIDSVNLYVQESRYQGPKL